jgi:hypothetical protein
MKMFFAGVVLLCGLALIFNHHYTEQRKLADHSRAVNAIAATKLDPAVFQRYCGKASRVRSGPQGRVILDYYASEVEVIFERSDVTYLCHHVISLEEVATRLGCKFQQ